MNWFKSIFSTSGIVKQGLDMVKGGADAVHFSGEEKTNAFLAFVKASLPMNVSRRVIACAVSAVWVIGFFIGSMVILFGHEAKKEYIEFLLYYVAAPFGVIVSWYFWKGIQNKQSQLEEKFDDYIKKLDDNK